MKMKSIKAIFRRGQSSKVEQQQQQQYQGQFVSNQPPGGGGGDLSRASSVTNLNADNKGNKGALSKLRKSASRDKLDRIAAEKKNDKKGVVKNNNKIESSGEHSYSTDSLQEIDFLQRQLQEMANEKSSLALQLGEQKGQLNTLRNEIAKLKMIHEQSSLQLEQLNEENTALRNRLRDVAHSPLSDNEKQQLLDSHRHHNSAPASIATNLLDDSSAGDITACPTPDWDKHSSSNVSEVSVACLQDKINQMQETHYSTNEELQATLQELTDLQRQLTELQQDNERLLEEKNLMFDSLCRQTERLNDTRSEVESLKQLLYRDKDDTGQFESIVEREQKLVDLLKSAQEERESLLLKQEQLNNELQEIRTVNIEQANEIVQLTERVKTLESTLDAKHAEHKQLDQELAIAKDQCSGRQIEINRLTDLLDNARTKINELEQDRALGDKSELDELLDNARKEKDSLESEVAHLKEQVARSRNETEKLREQVSILQEECKVTRNNAICTQSELEYKCEKLSSEKTNLSEQLQQLQEAANELQVQAQCQLEDKRQLSSVLSETQRNLSEAERRNAELENEIADLKRLRKEENEEWEKFQNDLLTSVRVANDFKTEAQQDLQKMIMENKAHRERVKQLEAQLDKLKGKSEKITRELRRDSKSRSSKNLEETSTGNVTSSSSASSKSDGGAKSKKRRSKQEEEYVAFINDEYSKIDFTKPPELLTGKEKYIISLKNMYDSVLHQTKTKPVASRPKENLAISKPLLSSVCSNPKLDEIAKDPTIRSIEEETPSDIHLGGQQKNSFITGSYDDIHKNILKTSIGINKKSCSYTDINFAMRQHEVSNLISNPFGSMEDLTKGDSKEAIPTKSSSDKKESSTIPHTTYSKVPENFNVDLIEAYNQSFLAQNQNVDDDNNEKVSYETLEYLYDKIDKSLSEEALSKEEKFVVKLKQSLDEMGRKRTLKALRKRKNLEISKPTFESVVKNPKLSAVLKDPNILFVDEIRKRNSFTIDDFLERHNWRGVVDIDVDEEKHSGGDGGGDRKKSSMEYFPVILDKDFSSRSIHFVNISVRSTLEKSHSSPELSYIGVRDCDTKTPYLDVDEYSSLTVDKGIGFVSFSEDTTKNISSTKDAYEVKDSSPFVTTKKDTFSSRQASKEAYDTCEDTMKGVRDNDSLGNSENHTKSTRLAQEENLNCSVCFEDTVPTPNKEDINTKSEDNASLRFSLAENNEKSTIAPDVFEDSLHPAIKEAGTVEEFIGEHDAAKSRGDLLEIDIKEDTIRDNKRDQKEYVDFEDSSSITGEEVTDKKSLVTQEKNLNYVAYSEDSGSKPVNTKSENDVSFPSAGDTFKDNEKSIIASNDFEISPPSTIEKSGSGDDSSKDTSKGNKNLTIASDDFEKEKDATKSKGDLLEVDSNEDTSGDNKGDPKVCVDFEVYSPSKLTEKSPNVPEEKKDPKDDSLLLLKDYTEDSSSEKVTYDSSQSFSSEDTQTNAKIDDSPLQSLTDEEILLVRSIKSKQKDRPLSDLNEDDLKIIEMASRSADTDKETEHKINVDYKPIYANYRMLLKKGLQSRLNRDSGVIKKRPMPLPRGVEGVDDDFDANLGLRENPEGLENKSDSHHGQNDRKAANSNGQKVDPTTSTRDDLTEHPNLGMFFEENSLVVEPRDSDDGFKTEDLLEVEPSEENLSFSQPKVIDYIVREQKNVQNKIDLCTTKPSYNTLERIATFHIINSPSKSNNQQKEPPLVNYSTNTFRTQIYPKKTTRSRSPSPSRKNHKNNIYELKHTKVSYNTKDTRESFEMAKKKFELIAAQCNQQKSKK